MVVLGRTDANVGRDTVVVVEIDMAVLLVDLRPGQVHESNPRLDETLDPLSNRACQSLSGKDKT